MKVLGVVLAMLVLTGVAWFAWHARHVVDSTTPLAPLTTSEQQSLELETTLKPADNMQRIPLGKAPAAGTTSKLPSGVITSNDVVVISSREGFPLRSIELAGPDGKWNVVELKASALPRSVLAAATSLRAPGHLAIGIDSSANEIVLDVDAMLTIECDSADRPLTLLFYKCDEFATRTSPLPPVCMEQLDAARVAIAMRCDVIDEFGGSKICVEAVWTSGSRSGICFHATPGAREHVRWPERKESPLVVHLNVDPAAPLDDVNVSLFEPRARNEGRRDAPVDDPTSHTYEWGTIAVYDAYDQKLSRGSSTADFEFSSVPLGKECVLIATDDTTKSWGVASFVHDGSPRRLEIHPPVVLTGRLVSHDGLLTSFSPQIDWTQRYRDDDAPAWRTQCSLAASRGKWLKMDKDGRFEIRGPSSMQAVLNYGDAIPPLVAVTIQARGFVPWTKNFTMDTTGRVDCGDIELDDVPSSVRVLLDDAETTTLVAQNREVILESEDGALESAIIRRIRANRGSLDLFLTRRARAEELHTDRAVRFITSPKGFELRGFEGVAPNTFRAVRTAKYDITFDTGADAPQVNTGVAWMGIRDEQAAGWRQPRGTRESVTSIVAPETGMSVWWILESTGASPNQSSQALNTPWPTIQPGESRVVIPNTARPK